MILILEADIDSEGHTYRHLMAHLDALPGIEHQAHRITGTERTITEVYLIGDTAGLDDESMRALPGVERVVRVSQPYRILGRHRDEQRATGFTYNGVEFSQDKLHVFAGLCAVDNRSNVDRMFATLSAHGQVCARMGAYKPRTSPYAFQGHGAECLPYVFELAGKHGIRVIAMEITHDEQVHAIEDALADAGYPTGVMLQIGTRNTQNFELLRRVGEQDHYPVLLKRGFGISLEESLNAAEYIAVAGNHRVIFCLRGMKTSMGDPHRNFVDFAHVPVVKRLTRMPVGIDPSHSVGSRVPCPDGVPDLMHATAQGVIAGANLVLVDFHPDPDRALVDGPQALTPDEMGYFLDDVAIAREAYERRCRLTQRQGSGETS